MRQLEKLMMKLLVLSLKKWRLLSVLLKRMKFVARRSQLKRLEEQNNPKMRLLQLKQNNLKLIVYQHPMREQEKMPLRSRTKSTKNLRPLDKMP